MTKPVCVKMDNVFWGNLLVCALPAYLLGLLTAWIIYLLSGVFTL